jgi:hypothetical protein
MTLRRSLASLLIVSLLAVAAATSAPAQNNSRQTGLVNISLGNVDVLNNVNLAVAANVAATVCNVTVPVAVLAQQVVAQGGDYTCDTRAGDLVIDQALNGARDTRPNAGGNNSRQTGLVNVSLGDVAILNDVNAAVAANIAVTACNLTIPIAVLATQIVALDGEYTCNTVAGPLEVTQSQ